jgi:hypothetical protein
MRQRADTLRIEQARMEGAMLAIRDLAGVRGVMTATNACLQRVVRASPQKDGYVG